MSCSLLRTKVTSLVSGSSRYSLMPSVRGFQRCPGRPNGCIASLRSAPTNCIVQQKSPVPVKLMGTNCVLHTFLHNSPSHSIYPSHSAAFSAFTSPERRYVGSTSHTTSFTQHLYLKNGPHTFFVRNASSNIPDDKKLNYDTLIKLMEKKEIILIDVRNRDEVKNSGTLPGSINIPVSELPTALKIPDKTFKQKYGFDKPQLDDPIVFFCASGNRSSRALNVVLQMGYKNLCISRSYSQQKRMSGGVGPDKIITYDDLVKLIERKEIYLIDVREPHELQETGELPGAVNIPLNQLRAALKDFSDNEFQKAFKARKPGMDAPLVFSCRSGVRSLKALQTALELGYAKAKHYKGGFLDWEKNTKSKK